MDPLLDPRTRTLLQAHSTPTPGRAWPPACLRGPEPCLHTARAWNWRRSSISLDFRPGFFLLRTPLPRYPANRTSAWRARVEHRPPRPAQPPQATLHGPSARAQATPIRFAGWPITRLASRFSRSAAGSLSVVATAPSLALPWWATRRSALKHPYSWTTGRQLCAPHRRAQHVLPPAPPPL